MYKYGKMEISIKNAEKMFGEALKVLSGKMPEAGEECEYCKYVKERKK